LDKKFLSEKDAPRSKATVLLVSNDAESARIWAFSLEQAGLEVCQAGFSEKTLQVWSNEFPDLIILDGHQAQMDLLEFCRCLRAEAAVPILLLSASGDETHLLAAYQAGVDDCLPPPVSPRLFLVKVRAWLRRAQVTPNAALDSIQAGDFRLDPDRRMVDTPRGDLVRLTNLEARLLYLLISHPDWILETDYLVDRTWGHFGDGDSVLLKNLVYRLRRKIEPDPSQPRYLLTESSLGYRFRPVGEAREAEAGGSVLPGESAKSRLKTSPRSTGQLHPHYPLLKE